MLQTLGIFLNWPGKPKWLVFLGLVAVSLIEGFGLATLLPALSIAFEPAGQTSATVQQLLDLLGRIGIAPELEIFFGAFIGLVALKAFLLIVVNSYVAGAVARLGAGMRMALIDHLSRASWDVHTEMPLGKLSNVMTIDVNRACKATQQSATVVAMLLQALIYVVLAFLISWQLALAGMTLALIIVVVLNPYVKRAGKQGDRIQSRMLGLSVILGDLLQNLKPVKAMDQQSVFIRYFEKLTNAFAKADRKQVVYQSTMKALREPLAAVLLVGGFYVAQLHLTLAMSDWVVMALVLLRLTSRLSTVQERLQVAVTFHASYREVQSLTQLLADRREPKSGTKAPTADDRICLENVTFRYGSKTVFDGLNLTIPMKGLTVVMGESGAGKSTLVDLLVGFRQPQEGVIKLDGQTLAEVDVKAWRRKLGYVPQEVVLFNDTLWVNLTLGDDSITEAVVEKALINAGAMDFVEALPQGWHSPMGEKGSLVSGGQRQRIGLARALTRQPSLLILDEVTSGLDGRNEDIIIERIKRISADIPVLVITHSERWLTMADRVYELTGPESDLNGGTNLVTAVAGGPEHQPAKVRQS